MQASIQSAAQFAEGELEMCVIGGNSAACSDGSQNSTFQALSASSRPR